MVVGEVVVCSALFVCGTDGAVGRLVLLLWVGLVEEFGVAGAVGAGPFAGVAVSVGAGVGVGVGFGAGAGVTVGFGACVGGRCWGRAGARHDSVRLLRSSGFAKVVVAC